MKESFIVEISLNFNNIIHDVFVELEDGGITTLDEVLEKVKETVCESIKPQDLPQLMLDLDPEEDPEDVDIEDYITITEEMCTFNMKGLPYFAKEMGWSEIETFLEEYYKSHNDLDVFESAYELGISFESVDDCYRGKWNSDEEFAEELVTSIGDLPDNMPSYIVIDWEATASNLMYDYSEYDGHYFNNY